MLIKSDANYVLDMPHDQKVEFTEQQLLAFAIWSVLAYHEKVPTLVLGDFSVWRDSQVIRIGDCKGCLGIGRILELSSKMVTLFPKHHIPSAMSIPERTLNSVRFSGDTLGYFDANNESLLPVALQHDKEKDEFHVILGEHHPTLINHSRYKFETLHEGQL